VRRRYDDQGTTDQSDNHRVSSSPSVDIRSSLWRVFCAINISENIRTQLVDHIRRLRESVPNANASWSRAGNIHLTLKFFGNVGVEDTRRLSDAAAVAGHGVSPFPISIGGTGVFPKHGAPRVLWVGIEDPSGNLTELQRRFEDECVREGFAKEERAFRPHLTLARLRSPQGARALADAHRQMEFPKTELTVSELFLIRSELSSEGSKYTTIKGHKLHLMSDML
jgi:2'-5' RNA ligase